MKNTSIFCSWSGGKDSCLALHRAIEEGAKPSRLLTMFTEGGQRSRSHGLDIQVICAQAEAMKIPLLSGNASWQDYQSVFYNMLLELKAAGNGLGVFGDIDIAEHRQWVHEVCSRAGVKAWHPLWQHDRLDLMEEFIALGYRAIIVAARQDLTRLLGRAFDSDLVYELKSLAIDPCGEQGEFHTVVVDGPIFSRAVELIPGAIVHRDGYSFLDYSPKLGKS